jgi:hypothetical protein
LRVPWGSVDVLIRVIALGLTPSNAYAFIHVSRDPLARVHCFKTRHVEKSAVVL